MRLVVTGHLGYIGTVLTPMLAHRGHEVMGIDSDLYERCTYGVQPIAEVPFIRKDVRDVERDELRGFDAVVHLAALSNDPLGSLNPDLTREINYRGTVNLARLAKEAGVPRFIFSSSCSNYGAAGEEMLDESSAQNPVTLYGASKVSAEADLAALADERFSPVSLRNATAYGLSPRIRFDLVVNNLTAWAFTTGKVFLKSDGSAWRPVVHVGDIAEAFVAVLEAPRELVHNEVFNVGRNDENYRVRELAEIVRGVVPGSRVEFASGASPDARCYRVDCSKIRRRLAAFSPRWTAAAGAAELYGALKDHGLSLEEFEGMRFRRVDHIRHLIAEGRLGADLRWTVPTAAGGSDGAPDAPNGPER